MKVRDLVDELTRLEPDLDVYINCPGASGLVMVHGNEERAFVIVPLPPSTIDRLRNYEDLKFRMR